MQTPNTAKAEPIRVDIGNAIGPGIIGNIIAQKLSLIKLQLSVITVSDDGNLAGIENNKHQYLLTREYLLKEFSDIFTGIGCFPGPEYHHIETDPEVTPIQHPSRQVPVHLQPVYKEEPIRLVKQGILKAVKDEYTPLIRSAVDTPKPNGSIRVFLDPRDLKNAIKCNRYYICSIDDVIPQVSGSTHFSKLDARSGHWPVQLNEESSRLCTFNTPWESTVKLDSPLDSHAAVMCSRTKWVLSSVL